MIGVSRITTGVLFMKAEATAADAKNRPMVSLG